MPTPSVVDDEIGVIIAVKNIVEPGEDISLGIQTEDRREHPC